MPELPEVETVVRGLRGRLEGAVLARALHASPLMVESPAGPFDSFIRGKRVVRIHRHGKWIFLDLEPDSVFAIHLGMTGHAEVALPTNPVLAHTHLRILLDRGDFEFRFTDPRRFGELILLSRLQWAERFGPGLLGIDALELTGKELSACVRQRKRSIKSLLLDQRLVAGIGNIYADEILFASGVHPKTPAGRLSLDRLEKLAEATREILGQAIEAGGSTIRDYASADGEPGRYQENHQVYGRPGKPCPRCQSPIRLDRGIVTGRATHFCPSCQPRRFRRPGSPATQLPKNGSLQTEKAHLIK